MQIIKVQSRVLLFPPPIKLTAMIIDVTEIVEIDIKRYNANPM
jgi:hypothetical protein